MKVFGIILALSVSSFAYSGQIITSDNVEVLALDGVAIKDGFFSKQKLEAENGARQIVVRYAQKFRNNNKFKNNGSLQSKPYIFMIEVDGETKLTTNKYTTYAQANRNLKEGLVWNVDNQKRQYTIEKTDELKGKGFMPYKNIELIVQEYNYSGNIASTEPINQDILNNKFSKSYLIEQYKAASQEQKQQFKLWLIQR